MIASLVYIMCAVTSIGCAWLLLANFRKSRSGLLFWSAACFMGLALSNVGLFVDLVLATKVDLVLIRTIPTLIGVYLLVWGLIWESS
jgi:hypothetical protein